MRLNVLRYADEIIAAKSLGLESFEVSDKELSIGSELIDKLTVPFHPKKHVDEHQIKLRQLIEKKAHGHKIVHPSLLLFAKHILQKNYFTTNEADLVLIAMGGNDEKIAKVT